MRHVHTYIPFLWDHMHIYLKIKAKENLIYFPIKKGYGSRFHTEDRPITRNLLFV